MTVSLDTGGLLTAVFRFIRRTGVLLLLLDAILSLAALAAALLLLAALAKADDHTYLGGFSFDSENGYPAESPRFGGSYGSGFDLIWDGKPYGDAVFTLGWGYDTYIKTIADPGLPTGRRVRVTAAPADAMIYGGMAHSLTGGHLTAAGNLLVVAPGPGPPLLYDGHTTEGGPAGGAVYHAGGDDSSVAEALYNTLIVDNAGSSDDEYYGGLVEMLSPGKARAEGNTAVLLDVVEPAQPNVIATFPWAAGGLVDFIAEVPLSGEGVANNNTIHAERSKVFYLMGGNVTFSLSANAEQRLEASGNRVIAYDTEVKRHVYGGFLGYSTAGQAATRAERNTVTLMGATSVGSDVAGAVVSANEFDPGNLFLGNTLNVSLPGPEGIRVGGYVRNFQTVNFLLSPDRDASVPALRAGTAIILYEPDMDRVSPLRDPGSGAVRETGVGRIDMAQGAGGPPEPGDTYVLMEAGPAEPGPQEGILTSDGEPFAQETASGIYGGTLALTFALSADARTITATLQKVEPLAEKPDAGQPSAPEQGAGDGADGTGPAPGEGGTGASPGTGGTGASPGTGGIAPGTGGAVAAPGPWRPDPAIPAAALAAAAAAGPGSLAFLGQGLDLLSDSLLELIASEGRRADSSRGYPTACPRPGFTLSAGASGLRGHGRYRSGGYAGLFSLSCSRELGGGTSAIGVFLEGGEGRYRYAAAGPLPARDPVSVGGDLSYRAAGIFTRHDFPQIRPGHLYVQGAVMAGKARTTSERRDRPEPGASFTIGRRFTGGTLGAGFVAWLGWNDTLDISARYIRIRMRGGSFQTDAGDRIDLDDAVSSRVRAGLAWSRALTARAAMRLGIAADLEFLGRSRARSLGAELPSPSLRGVTGILEAGFDFKPEIGSPLTFYLSAQGFAGVRRGGTGRAGFSYSF
ncbi:MAG: hypothetical protein LBG06_10235 [Deltaproteobacteria bacterium]|jgi:hypothetical protein|nr:hypothetical protein [Deltaproteobacteria bacterium]